MVFSAIHPFEGGIFRKTIPNKFHFEDSCIQYCLDYIGVERLTHLTPKCQKKNAQTDQFDTNLIQTFTFVPVNPHFGSRLVDHEFYMKITIKHSITCDCNLYNEIQNCLRFIQILERKYCISLKKNAGKE